MRYFMAYILMTLMTSTLAILMLFQDIPNISFSPSMVVDLVDLVRRTLCVRPIFDVYILLFDPYLIARNRSLRLNEKKTT